MTDDRRALAERLARDVCKNDGVVFDGLYPWLRKAAVECVLAGLSHRDQHAEREAARKAWDAALAQYGIPYSPQAFARYLAATYPTAERVTLSDGSVVTRNGTRIIRQWDGDTGRSKLTDAASWHFLIGKSDTGADFDAVKALAARLDAERAQ